VRCFLTNSLKWALAVALTLNAALGQGGAAGLRARAEKGDADAQFNLGVKYYRGDGVPKDAVQAATWYRRAAEQGAASAQYNLGLMHTSGEGVPKDAVQAASWFRKAAEQGYALAQNNLGAM